MFPALICLFRGCQIFICNESKDKIMKRSLSNYLLEVRLGKSPEIEDLFNAALGQIFSKKYLQKIENIIRKRIKIKEVKMKPGAVAFNTGNTIFISKDEFPKIKKDKQINYLLHEFIHILQRKKAFFIFSRFKDLNNLTKKLVPIVDKHATNLSVFLTGKNVNLGPGKSHEILAYLLTNSIKWNAISSEGKMAFIQELKRSGLFNLDSKIWRIFLK